MLPKERRIPRELFKSILAGGEYSNSEHFALKSSLGSAKLARIAVSVSKKVARGAVARNRIRRRAYSSVARLIPYLLPRLYLIIARAGASGVKGQLLNKEMGTLFSKYIKTK